MAEKHNFSYIYFTAIGMIYYIFNHLLKQSGNIRKMTKYKDKEKHYSKNPFLFTDFSTMNC